MAALTHQLTALVDTPDTEPLSLSPPHSMGRYEIEAEIGCGSMGVVYRAVDPVLERRVALKVVRVPFGVSEEERRATEQRFLREASLAGCLSHPNIVVVHDFGWDEEVDLPFIALEYLEGRTLAELIAGEGRPDWREALRIVGRLADALAHAHAQGVIHRDVKPSNVMLLPSGQPKILDFGIARAATAQLTGMTDTWGTPCYMSPEQVTGAAVDCRSDLFSLGSLCFELLTGRQAFAGSNVPQIVARIAWGEAPRPTHYDPRLPGALDVLLARALAKDPARRYRDGRTFAQDIDDILAGRELRARPELAHPLDHADPDTVPTVALTPLARAASPVLRRRWRAAIAAALVGTVVLLSLAAMASAPAAAPPPASAPAPAAVAAPVPAPVPVPVVSQPVVRPSAPPARVALSIEHGLERGRLKVFLDDQLVLDRALSGKATRRLLVFKRSSGALVEVVDVPPGPHALRFEVEADGARSVGIARGAFRSQQTRLLRVRADARRIDLKWQS